MKEDKAIDIQYFPFAVKQSTVEMMLDQMNNKSLIVPGKIKTLHGFKAIEAKEEYLKTWTADKLITPTGSK